MRILNPSSGIFLLVALMASACANGVGETAPGAAFPTEQFEITQAAPLLNSDGSLRQAGWSRREVLTYNPDAILPGERNRLREWDFYAMQNTQGSLSLTVMNIGFITLCAVDWLDFTTGKTATAAFPQLSGDELIRLSSSAHGETVCRRSGDADPVLSFSTIKNERHLKFDFAATSWGPAMRGHFILREHPEQEYLALATPFAADPFAFFYEQKIPGTETVGSLQIDATTVSFTATDAVAFMDWGRGVWPAQLLWRWGAAGGRLADGRRFGLNIGNGYGDPSAGTPDIFVIDGKAHKLGAIEWVYDREHPEKPWTFRSTDGAVDLKLVPQRASDTGLNLILKYNKTLKAYGTLHGRIRLSGGEEFNITTPTAFAEEVQIRW